MSTVDGFKRLTPRTLLYVAGPYSGDIPNNIKKAEEVAKLLWHLGFSVICPHLNTANFEVPGVTYDDYIEGDLEMISRCDGIVMLPNWTKSKGACIEHDFASGIGIPIYILTSTDGILVWEDNNVPRPHPVLKSSPLQARAFLLTVMRMYHVHLDKNRDYSPANILGTGEIGVVTRIWDKVARLMNLVGFKLEVHAPAKFTSPEVPMHESIDDTLIDLANYSIILKLLRSRHWGH